MSNEHIPLIMGDKVIGAIRIDNNGEFDGHFEKEAIDILREGIKDGVRSVTIASIFGLAAKQDMSAQEKWSAYLRETREPEYWTVRNVFSEELKARNLPSADAAKAFAMELSSVQGESYRWYKQSTKIEEKNDV